MQERQFYWSIIEALNLPFDIDFMKMDHVKTLMARGNLPSQDYELVARLAGINTFDNKAPI